MKESQCLCSRHTVINQDFRLLGRVILRQVRSGTHDCHCTHSCQIYALPFSGADAPGHHRVASSSCDLTVVMTSAGEDTRGSHLDVITSQADIFSPRAKHQTTYRNHSDQT